MADLDAELLALAGGDSSEDEGPNLTTTATKTVLPPSASVTVHANPEESSAHKPIAAAKPSQRSNGGTSKGSKKAKMNDSEEEGEALVHQAPSRGEA